METVCVCARADAAPAERERGGTDSGGGGRDRRARFHFPVVHRLGLRRSRRVGRVNGRVHTGQPERSTSVRSLPHGARCMCSRWSRSCVDGCVFDGSRRFDRKTVINGAVNGD